MFVEEEEPVIGPAGVIAAAFATGLVLVVWMGLLSAGKAPGWPVLIAICLAAGAMIVILCRVAMPGGLRVPLILALIATMLFAVVRADPFGIRMVGDGVAQEAAEIHRGRLALSRYAGFTPADAVPPGGGETGAGVSFIAGDGGGSGWARAINQAWNGRIGGAAARSLRITGTVDGAMPVAAEWEISSDGNTVRCGRTSVAGADRGVVVEAFREPLAQAVRRSVSLGRASCP